MAIEAVANLNCSIARPLSFLGERWALLAERQRYSEHPERFEYRLTEKGCDLQPVLLAMLAWGDRYTARPASPPLETVHGECGKAFHMVSTCWECGGEVDTRHTHCRPGPGATAEQRRRADAQKQRTAERRAA
jgi:DNA-binding HxlR family transcriptional regulator